MITNETSLGQKLQELVGLSVISPAHCGKITTISADSEIGSVATITYTGHTHGLISACELIKSLNKAGLTKLSHDPAQAPRILQDYEIESVKTELSKETPVKLGDNVMVSIDSYGNTKVFVQFVEHDSKVSEKLDSAINDLTADRKIQADINGLWAEKIAKKAIDTAKIL